MTGKELRKMLKRIFKERGLDDKDLDFIGNDILTFRPSTRSLEEQLEGVDEHWERLKIIDEFYDKPIFEIRIDKKTKELVLKEMD